MDLLLASSNRGKLREIKAILGELPLQLLLPADLGLTLAVEESGLTFAENAAIKARAYCQAGGRIALADDSGLLVDALDGAPGLHSARYSPLPNAGDADRRAHLLKNLVDIPVPPGDPGWEAHFHCSVAIATPSGELYTAEGDCPGFIIAQERGSNGFGYDPIFFMPEFLATMAQLSDEVKNSVSHRARALQAALPLLDDLLHADAYPHLPADNSAFPAV